MDNQALPEDELAEKIRSYIPDGDGYNSDYALTLAAAADALTALRAELAREREFICKKCGLRQTLGASDAPEF